MNSKSRLSLLVVMIVATIITIPLRDWGKYLPDSWLSTTLVVMGPTLVGMMWYAIFMYIAAKVVPKTWPPSFQIALILFAPLTALAWLMWQGPRYVLSKLKE